MVKGVPVRQFLEELQHEIRKDNLSTGAAALAFYSTLALFPAAIFVLSLLPYLPIPHLEQAILDLLRQLMPGGAAQLFTSTVHGVVAQRRGGLLSFGFVFTVWSASTGLWAIMQQLNNTYDVTEGRPFWKVRLIAIGLTIAAFVLLTGTLGLVIFDGAIQDWLVRHVGLGRVVLVFFATVRWVIIALATTLAFALVYYFGPDVEQKFRFVTPGGVFGTIGVLVVSLLFRLYAGNFAHYDRTYGSIGAVIALMVWLFLVGWVLLLGSEINALVEHYSPSGKPKGRKHPAPEPRHGWHPERA